MSYQTSKEYNDSLNLKRYDLGGVGPRRGENNWYTINIIQSACPDLVLDVRKLDRIASENSLAELYLSHIFEHFYHGEQIDLLKYWITFLCEGGCIRIKLTDMEFLVREYVQEKIPWIVLAGCGWVPGSKNKEHSPYIIHHWGFSEDYLKDTMTAAGLVDVQREDVPGWVLDFDETQNTGLNNKYIVKNLQVVGFKKKNNDII